MNLLALNVTSIATDEFRVYGSTVYANVVIQLARPDGVLVAPRPEHKQLDLNRYPDLAAVFAQAQALITKAYLFEEAMAPDPGQAYNPPPVEETPTEPQP
jgi:hypothetical protein